MSEISYYSAHDKVRRVGLIGWGVVMIVVGSFFALGSVAGIVLFQFAMSRLPPTTAPSPPHMKLTMFMGLAMYVIAAIALIWTGIGSCMGRRWVRPVVMITSLPVAIVGLFSVAMMVVAFMQNAGGMISGVPAASASMVRWMTLVGGVVEFAIMVILPGVMFWFYQRTATREALQMLDIAPRRWTDGRPVPLLGWAVGCGVMGCSNILVVSGGYVPFFNTILSGVAAIGYGLIFAALMIIGGWLCYQKRVSGWWITMSTLLLLLSSSSTFAVLGDSTKFQEAVMGAQAATAQTESIMASSRVGGIVYFIVIIGFGLYVRRFFPPTPGEDERPLPV